MHIIFGTPTVTFLTVLLRGWGGGGGVEGVEGVEGVHLNPPPPPFGLLKILYTA